jgi:hypothetical protein
MPRSRCGSSPIPIRSSPVITRPCWRASMPPLPAGRSSALWGAPWNRRAPRSRRRIAMGADAARRRSRHAAVHRLFDRRPRAAVTLCGGQRRRRGSAPTPDHQPGAAGRRPARPARRTRSGTGRRADRQPRVDRQPQQANLICQQGLCASGRLVGSQASHRPMPAPSANARWRAAAGALSTRSMVTTGSSRLSPMIETALAFNHADSQIQS